MRKWVGGLVAGAALIWAGAAAAQPRPAHNWITPPDQAGASSDRLAYYTGNALLELCETNEFACTTYIQGVADGQLAAVTATSRDVVYCIPEGSEAGQVRDIVVQYLKSHPQTRHRLAGLLVANALMNAWPQCRASQ